MSLASFSAFETLLDRSVAVLLALGVAVAGATVFLIL